jgi:hypothetical protein
VRRIAPWLIAIAFYGLLAPLGLADIDGGPLGWILPILTAVGCVLPLIVAHECGHLLAALVLRLPVAGMRIRLTETSFVRVRPSPSAPALPLRFVVLHLAGPLVNLGLAYGLVRFATGDEVSDLARSCVLTVFLLSVVIGVANLLPHRDSSGMHSDGARIWSWIVHPSREREALRRAAPRPMTAHPRRREAATSHAAVTAASPGASSPAASSTSPGAGPPSAP